MNKKQLMKMLDEMVESSVQVAESHATNGRPDAARYWTGRADAYRLVISSIDAYDTRPVSPKMASEWGAEDYRPKAEIDTTPTQSEGSLQNGNYECKSYE